MSHSVLIVDDEPLLLRSVRRLLPEYELVCLESARQALALLDAGTVFDLVVSDLMMPEMNGIDFYEALRVRHPAVAERVIFVTGGALGQQVGRALSWARGEWLGNSRLSGPLEGAPRAPLPERQRRRHGPLTCAPRSLAVKLRNSTARWR